MSKEQRVDALEVFNQMSEEEQEAFIRKLSRSQLRQLRRLFAESLFRRVLTQD